MMHWHKGRGAAAAWDSWCQIWMLEQKTAEGKIGGSSLHFKLKMTGSDSPLGRVWNKSWVLYFIEGNTIKHAGGQNNNQENTVMEHRVVSFFKR